MKWSSHIEVACSKAKRILGLLYRRFYGLADCRTIIQLYLSTVRPHLEYASSLWDPHTQKDITALERVQKFACKIATKHWNCEYQQLLETCAIPSLAERRTKLKLYQLYNILYGHSHFPQNIFVHLSHHYPTRSHHMVLSQPLTHTNDIHFYIHSSLTPFLCGTTCLKSKYLLPHYKLLRDYFISIIVSRDYFNISPFIVVFYSHLCSLN